MKLFLLIFLLACVILPALAQENNNQPDQTLSLPTNLWPLQYVLNIIVELEPDFKFGGDVTIQMICGKETKTIMINFSSLEIPIDKITVTKLEIDKWISLSSKTTADEKSQLLTITVDEGLQVMRTYEVKISFSGKLESKLTGFYPSSYYDVGSKTIKWLAVTQAEPSYARCIYPSMDQPDMKSKFIISIGHKENLKVLTNAPFDKDEPMKDKPGWVLSHFQSTEQISTYSVTILVSEFVNSNDKTTLPPDNIPVGFWSRPDVKDQMDFASEIVVDALKFFADLFKFPFTFKKFDIAVIPDFQSINKEGFKMATFGESDALFHPEWSSDADQANTALIVSHYMAKQWMGDLASMDWFDNLWLKEGFCNYFARIFINNKFPKWNPLLIEFVDAFIDSLTADGLQASHPLFFPIERLTQIDLLYDTISFKKGSLIARLLATMVGEDVFNDTLVVFISTYIYKSTKLDDFWKIFDETAGKNSKLPEGADVKTVMGSWVNQPNYPLLTVIKEGDGVTVSQEAFIFNPKKDDANEKKPCWWMPLIYTISSKMDYEKPSIQWLKCEEKVKLDVKLGPEEYLLLNLKMAALCRVDYGEEMWISITRTLLDDKKFTTIDVFSRVQLLSDMYGLAWIGRMKYPFMFEAFNFLKHETEFAVWRNAWSLLGYLRKMLSATQWAMAFEQFTRSLVEPTFTNFGAIDDFPTDDPLKSRFKSFFISQSCAFAIESCVTPAVQLFQKWFQSADALEKNPIHRNIRLTVYCQGIAFGGQAEWDFLFNQYQSTIVASERKVLQRALGCSPNETILRQYLEYSIDPKISRLQDSSVIFVGMSTSDASFYVTRQFFFEKFQEIYDFNKGNQVALGQYLVALYSRIMTETELQEMETFIETVADKLTGADLRLNEARSIADDNIAWHQRRIDGISQALQGFMNA